MGNTFDKSPTTPYNKSLLTQIRERTLVELLDCYAILNQDYPECHSLDFSLFEDVFGPMIDDPEPFFLELQNEHNIDGTIDLYETLATLAVFVKEKFEKKVSFIFQLFDFDHSNSLEQSELAITLQSVARGLCKVTHIPLPTMQIMEIQARLVFVAMDRDNNQRITFDEFMMWIKQNNDLQEFILKYAGIQTLDNMILRFSAVCSLCFHYFIQSSGAAGAEFAEERKLKDFLRGDKKLNLSKTDMEFLFDLLHTTSASFIEGRQQQDKTLISRRAFEHVMKAWCAYSASDINGVNSLSINELHAILWLYEGQEPTEERVLEDMKVMDKDGNREIDRYEWMRHLCLTDKSGKMVFRSSLKKLFERYDKDNSGYLSLTELKDLVREAFREYMKERKDIKVRKTLEEMIDTLTKEIFAELDANNNTNVDWEEFKTYMEVAMNKIEKLKGFLVVNASALKCLEVAR